MTAGRRGVTRGYVGGLIAAADVVAFALLIAVWGLTSLALDREPVSSAAVPLWAAPILIVIGIALLSWSLWRQALALLRGRRGPSWSEIITVSLGAYLVWSLGGFLAGMSVEETFVSPFAALLVPIWGLSAILFWAVLARRVFTDRDVPKWPWERREEDDS